MAKKQSFTIEKVNDETRDQVGAFMIAIRKTLFPMLDNAALSANTIHDETAYIQQKHAAIFAAFTEDRHVIGTIGIQPYDGRFKQLKACYEHVHTAEIIKCYIAANYRRIGIGTSLFKQATCFCKAEGYETLYLHTHPFLPGGLPFWKARGFVERLTEVDPVWHTIHMDKPLS